MMRVPVPARLKKAVRSWFDSRYISVADHRQDIKDALWEVQTLRREVTTLQEEVRRLRAVKQQAPQAGAKVAEEKAAEAHRLAFETAQALDRILQNEVLLWQAVDELRTAKERLVGGHRTVNEPSVGSTAAEEQSCA
ncbi:hypothetical protein [Nonomuraea dietziae]|uniref:hypothetical protein n=1 Tax=Nonomuraea dietziae TaxID=65515 RepID=UPI0033D4561C